ncbi:MAG: alpha/beta hydrolase [Chitinophagaceae bacterium]
MKMYFISGLGADRRVFSLLDLSFCEPVFLDWVTPDPSDTLATYAAKMRALIPEEAPVIVGLSLGGMLATEIAKADPKVKSILISSNKTSHEFPAYLKMFRYFPVYKWIPGVVMKNMQSLYTYSFGVKDPEQKKILYAIIKDADIPFVRWALGAIMNWNSTVAPSNIVQIHGTGDRLFRAKYIKADYVIDGGSHTMTMDKHAEISVLLKQLTKDRRRSF